MNKFYPLVFLVLLLSLFSASAYVISFNASQTSYHCYGGWLNQTYAHDNLFTTYAHTLPGSAGFCNFLYPSTPGYAAATGFIRTSFGEYANFSVPLSCWVNNRLNLSVVSTYDAVSNSTGVNCLNSSGSLQSLYQNGAGDDVGSKTRFYELQTEINYSGASGCPANPADPIYANDDFSYTDSTDTCGWQNAPVTSIYPTGGQLCFNGSLATQRMSFYLGGQGHTYGSQVFTEEFDLTLSNESVFLEKSLGFSPLGLDWLKGYVFDFQNSGGTISVSYLEITPNGTTSMSLCSGCFLPGVSTHVKVVIYGPEADTYSVLNTTSGLVQAIQPNSISVKIGNGSLHFNIPFLEENPGTELLPRYANFDIYQGRFCTDNYIIFSGTINAPLDEINNTNDPFLQVGESCAEDWECFTKLCNYLHLCDRKGFLAPCVSNVECQSGVCTNGKCTKPSLWTTIDQTKTDTAGNDEATNNLVSIIIALVISIALMVVCWRLGAGELSAVAGGVNFIIAMFFFTLGGWLSPFILIGLVIVMVLVIVFGVILRQ